MVMSRYKGRQNVKAFEPVTIASVRAHGVRSLLVYCNGKREGDWPCHHQGKLSIDCFDDGVPLRDIERRCRCTACGWRRADLRPDYSVQQATRQSLGWVILPTMAKFKAPWTKSDDADGS